MGVSRDDYGQMPVRAEGMMKENVEDGLEWSVLEADIFRLHCWAK